MKAIQEKAGKLWRLCVKYRDKWCFICGMTPEKPEMLDAHHIWFRSQGNWKVLYDIDFGCALCSDCHLTRPEAPHVDNKAFIDKIIPRLSHERQSKLCEFLWNPVEICTESADWHEICCDLALKLKHYQEWYEISRYDHEDIFRGRNHGT